MSDRMLDYNGLTRYTKKMLQRIQAAGFITAETETVIWGNSVGRSVNDAIYVLGLYAASNGKLVEILVVDEDNVPIEGVTLSGATTPNGSTPVTSEKGTVVISISGSTGVSFSTPYTDIPTKTETITPNSTSIVSSVKVVIPYATKNTIIELTASGNCKLRKDHTTLISVVGGGAGGTGGMSGSGGTGSSYGYGGSAGAGGSRGLVSNQETLLQKNITYSFTIGAGGAGGTGGVPTDRYQVNGNSGSPGGVTTFSSISSANGSSTDIPLNDQSLSSKYCANGSYGYSGTAGASGGVAGTGGKGGGTSGATGSAGGSQGGRGGSGGQGGQGGNGGGGGGGGGGATNMSANTRGGAGGSGGSGGRGIVLIKFLT